jgi:adenine-specific DNA-methyltransferase
MTHDPTFPYISGDSYVSRTFLIIKPRNTQINLKFLSCLLNSKLAKFWFYNFGKRKGNLLQIDKEPLLGFPIKKLSTKDQGQFDGYANKIIAILQSNELKKELKIHDIERRINELIYKFYNLTEDEVNIVENNNK